MFANYEEIFKRFVLNEQDFLFMNQIKGSVAHQGEVLQILKLLRCPTFLILSCADLRWNELVEIISKINSIDLTKENAEGLIYLGR